MKRFFLLLLMVTALPVMAATEAKPPAPSNLTLIADESLLQALAPITRRYATVTHTPLTIVLKNSEGTATQIEQGLEAHVLITADQTLLRRVNEQGLMDVNSRRVVAQTPLVLVTGSGISKSASLAKRISFAATLYATPDQPVYADGPMSLDGAAVSKLLSGYEFSEVLAKRLQVKPSHADVVDALRDGPGLGLMLAADALLERDLRALAVVPEEISPPVRYEAVVLGSELMPASKKFVDYLNSREAAQIFAKYGYLPASPPAAAAR